MKLVLLGAPGSGKGTEAEFLTEHLEVPHISTGDILRQSIAERTPMGEKAREFVEGGGLVPDEIVAGMIEERLSKEDCRTGFILDGFPRTVDQADTLRTILDNLGYSLDLALHLEAPAEILVGRLAGRRVCRECQSLFHIKNMPPKKEGICDRCGGELYLRPDDHEDVIRNRLKIYNSKVKALLNYYRERNLLHTVDSTEGPQETFESIKKIIDGGM